MRLRWPARLTGALVSTLVLSGALAGPALAGTGGDTYAYVTNQTDGTLQPVDVTTGTAGTPISLGSGSQPSAIALAPKGTAKVGTAYVTEKGKNQVAVIDIASDPAAPTVKSLIPTGGQPVAIAITPNGNKAYVANYGSGTVTAISFTGTNPTTQQINVGGNPQALAVTPNGELVYVLRGGGTPVVPIITSTNRLGPGFGGVGANPIAIAINPNGKTGYVASPSGAQVVPFSIPEEQAAAPANQISTPAGPWALTTTADGSSTLVATALSPVGLSKINLATGNIVTAPLANSPWAVTLGPQGTAYANDAYVVAQNGASAGSVSEVDLTSMTVTHTITVGIAPSAIGVSPWIPAVTGTGGDPYNLGNLGSATKPKHHPRPRLRGRSIRVGNQRISLAPTVHGSVTRRGRRLCVGPKATLIFRLQSHRLRRGPGTRVSDVMMYLGRRRRASRRHAPVAIRVRHLRRGRHTVTAKLVVTEHRVRHVRRHHHRVKLRRTVHLHRTLRIRFNVC